MSKNYSDFRTVSPFALGYPERPYPFLAADKLDALYK